MENQVRSSRQAVADGYIVSMMPHKYHNVKGSGSLKCKESSYKAWMH